MDEYSNGWLVKLKQINTRKSVVAKFHYVLLQILRCMKIKIKINDLCLISMAVSKCEGRLCVSSYISIKECNQEIELYFCIVLRWFLVLLMLLPPTFQFTKFNLSNTFMCKNSIFLSKLIVKTNIKMQVVVVIFFLFSFFFLSQLNFF